MSCAIPGPQGGPFLDSARSPSRAPPEGPRPIYNYEGVLKGKSESLLVHPFDPSRADEEKGAHK